jgi:hypothetical protein
MVDRDELLVSIFRILYEIAIKQEQMCKQQDLCITVGSILIATVMVGGIGASIYFWRRK